MKHKLVSKLTVGYILIFCAMFLFVNTAIVHSIHQRQMKRTISTLYQEAQNISHEYLDSYYGNNMTLENLLVQLKLVDGFNDTRILLLNSSGKVVADTRQSLMIGNALSVSETFLSKSYSKNETLDGLFNEPMLSVVYPLNSNVNVLGYLTVHYPMEKIQESVYYQVNNINLCLIFVFVVLLASYLLIIYAILRPLQKIRTGIKEFTDGNYNYNIEVSSQDEFYSLATAINYMGQQLANLDEYQKNFIANISHDFRSPLTSIKGYAEAMKDGTIPVEMQDKYLDIILFESERLTKLTSNLLTLNNMQYNGSLLNIKVFDINQIVKKTAEVFEGICTKKKITIELSFIADKSMVCGDVDKIQQVLYNLLDNAIKFSNNNSTIEMSVTEKLDKIYVAIKDHGVGIPNDCIYKIWDRFYKTDHSRGKDKKGTGLGLAIVKEIINAHGENITVVSTVNVGTEFIFTLSIPEEE